MLSPLCASPYPRRPFVPLPSPLPHPSLQTSRTGFLPSFLGPPSRPPRVYCILILKATPSNPVPEAAEAQSPTAARVSRGAGAPGFPISRRGNAERFRELAATFAAGNSAGFVLAVLIQTPPHCLFQRCANYYLDSRAQSPCPFPSTK